VKYIDHGAGGPAACMQIAEGPSPRPGAGEVLIKVTHAGVNRPDVLQRSGRYPPPPGASPVLGLEVAGTIVEVGADVGAKLGVEPAATADQWAMGDRVTALVPGGGYAEYCVAPAGHVLPIPGGMDLVQAAALPETWFTVWANLVDLGRLKQGERVLIHGGSSGIGLTAIQLAKFIGAEVFVTVGSDEKAQFCRKAGADHAINYRNASFVDAVKEITQGQGVDVILDMVGAPYAQSNLSLLRRDGRLVIIAFLEGSKGELDLLPVMMKRLTITGSTMRPRTIDEKTALRDALRASIWPQLASGAMRPHIHARFPLSQAADAHRLMESSQHIGKIVLDVSP
jgi:putative PIG3 family NAD(P)H quinone oxidoreductase